MEDLNFRKSQSKNTDTHFIVFKMKTIYNKFIKVNKNYFVFKAFEYKIIDKIIKKTNSIKYREKVILLIS